MHNKTWNDLEALRKAKCTLSFMLECELAKGENSDPKELMMMTDMIKDLAEAEEKCMKAVFYKEELDYEKKDREEEEKESDREGYTSRGSRSSRGRSGGRGRSGYPMEDEYEDMMRRGMIGPMGYDHWHYANGKFAPTGSGHYVSGYPMGGNYGYGDGGQSGNYGYGNGGNGGGQGGSSGGSGYSGNGSSGGNNSGYSSNGGSGNSSGGNGGGNYGYPNMMGGYGNMGWTPNMMDPNLRQYGKAYDEWKEARRHYTQNSSPSDKDEMERKGMEHVMNMIMTFREIWKHADPDMRKRMKSDLSALVTEMA